MYVSRGIKTQAVFENHGTFKKNGRCFATRRQIVSRVFEAMRSKYAKRHFSFGILKCKYKSGEETALRINLKKFKEL